MFRNSTHKTIFGIWIGWVVVMLAYQVWAPARLKVATPDYAKDWTVSETIPGSQSDKPYLNEPFLNQHVSWDSEFYLSIATGGYEAPNIRRIGEGFTFGNGIYTGYWPFVIPPSQGEFRQGIPLSYAFFPFYPFVIRLISIPLSLLGMNPIATATLGGVIVSMLGTLAGMFALYELAKNELGEEGGLRAAFYLIIFPSGFFLAQVYTEGLFVGLAFTSLALLRRGKRGWAVILAVFATYTRAVGIVLVLPILISWIKEGEWRQLDLEWREIYFKGLPWKAIGKMLFFFLPVFAFLLWKISYYGMAFSRVEEEFFGRGFLQLGDVFTFWSAGFRDLLGSNPQAATYYALEWGGRAFGICSLYRGIQTTSRLGNIWICRCFSFIYKWPGARYAPLYFGGASGFLIPQSFGK